MTFAIEKNIPLPSPPRGSRVWPFTSMSVGDSFFIASDLHRKVVSAAHSAGRQHNMKFSVRLVDGGYRCWRVA